MTNPTVSAPRESHGDPAVEDAAAYWDRFYRAQPADEQDPIPRANALLVEQVTSLRPARALDLGSGRGGDAIWLAQQGWTVTATDVSAAALEHGARSATAAGVGTAIRWERHDLSATLPVGPFDLVSSQYLQSPVAAPGERLATLRRAVSAVAPRGSMIIVGHGDWPDWLTTPPGDFHFDTNAEVLTALQLSDGDWQTLRDDTVPREVNGPDGQRGTRHDHVLHLRRT